MSATGNIFMKISFFIALWFVNIIDKLAIVVTYNHKKTISFVSMKKLRTAKAIVNHQKPTMLSVKKAKKNTNHIIIDIFLVLL